MIWAELHQIQSSISNSLIGDWDQKYGLRNFKPLTFQVHPMSTHLAIFEPWLAKNFPSFVRLVVIRLTKSLGPKVRNGFPLTWWKGGIHKPCGQRRGEGGFLKKPCRSTWGGVKGRSTWTKIITYLLTIYCTKCYTVARIWCIQLNNYFMGFL